MEIFGLGKCVTKDRQEAEEQEELIHNKVCKYGVG